jgi:peptidoglycan hydrolase-like protein with peptidoglycan-binding domain
MGEMLARRLPGSLRSIGKRRIAALAVVALVALAVVGWAAARQIRSPAQIAADTAAPPPSPITVPVTRRTLSTVVIVRGTVRYGAPQPAVLGTSRVKQGSDIVTRPPRRRAQLGVGDVALSVDGRPVFVLPGAIPMSRDLHRGLAGPDVRQLEEALAGLGLSPGAVDGRYDTATERAVSAFYLRHGWDPFGPTDLQREQLRTAEAAAAQARDAHLQALSTIDQTRTATPAEVQQARLDAVTARDALDTAVLGVSSAEAKLTQARATAASLSGGETVAIANDKREQAAAAVDVAGKQAALNAAITEERSARQTLLEVAPDAPPSERQAAAAAASAAAAAIPQAQAELDAALAAAEAVRVAGPDAQRKARTDAAQAVVDVRVAADELRRARQAVRTARATLRLSTRRVRILSRPADTSTMRAIAAATAQEARRTEAEVARIAAESNIQVPANEILFFPTLPLRVDAVKARRGSQVSGSVMNVTSSRLAIDSSLSVSDAKLVHPGDRVVIEDQDLGIKAHGVVSQVADTPGTNRVDPSRFYMGVSPEAGVRALVGASVKLTIAVKSTSGAVLAVPASALSIGGDGNSRVQVRRGGRTQIVKVVPGLAAEGLVEVRPVQPEGLAPGELVIVGSRRG